MRMEVQVEAVVETDPFGGSPTLYVSWHANGKVYGARLPLTEGMDLPPLAPPPVDPLKKQHPNLNDQDISWLRRQMHIGRN